MSSVDSASCRPSGFQVPRRGEEERSAIPSKKMMEPQITPYRDGPYLIRGAFSLVDQEGREIELRRRVVALCRCGRSRIRPFCDGTHKQIGFQAESGPPAPIATVDEP